MDGGNRSTVIKLQNGSWPNALTLDSECKYFIYIFQIKKLIARVETYIVMRSYLNHFAATNN